MSARFKNGDKVTIGVDGEILAGTIVGDGSPTFAYLVKTDKGGMTTRREQQLMSAAGGRRTRKHRSRRRRSRRHH